MTISDVLLLAILIVCAVGILFLNSRLRDISDILTALAEMLGEEIDRRKEQDE